jgi:hypothetical protein
MKYDYLSSDEVLLQRFLDVSARIHGLRACAELQKSLHRQTVLDPLVEAEQLINEAYEKLHYCVHPDKNAYLEILRQLLAESLQEHIVIPKIVDNN